MDATKLGHLEMSRRSPRHTAKQIGPDAISKANTDVGKITILTEGTEEGILRRGDKYISEDDNATGDAKYESRDFKKQTKPVRGEGERR